MSRSILAIVLIISAAITGQAAGEEKFDHTPLEHVLHKFVNENGYVNYTGLKADRAELDSYVAALERTSPENTPALFPDRASQLAYWINAYNALVLQAVINNYSKHDLRSLLSRYKFFLRTKRLIGGN